MSDILLRIRADFSQHNVIYSKHVAERMFERDITETQIESIINDGIVKEEYTDDYPCPSVMIETFLDVIKYHLVAANCPEY